MSVESSGGWYNTRRQYRSVAFGTWKVGGARGMTERKREDHSPPVVIRKKRPLAGLDRQSRRMGESSPDLARIHPSHTLRSLGALPSSISTTENTLASTLVGGDCYSSSEYVEYSAGKPASQDDGDSCNGNTVSEPIGAAFRADRNLNYSLSTKRRGRLETSLHRAHQRSHSAGADAQLSVNRNNITNNNIDMKNPLSLGRDVANSNAKFLRATKKFFRKIYNTATLPNRKHSADTARTEPVVVEEKLHRAPLMSDDENDVTSRIEDFRLRQNGYSKNTLLDTSYPDSGLDMDRASTPDQSLESMTFTSKSDSSSETRPEQMPWEDLFEHLRREMHQMRERDVQILADLHRVESSIREVKRAQREAEGASQPVQSIPL